MIWLAVLAFPYHHIKISLEINQKLQNIMTENMKGSVLKYIYVCMEERVRVSITSLWVHVFKDYPLDELHVLYTIT